jgi:hypothetical protein
MSEDTNKSKTGSDKDRDSHLEEWKKARAVLEFFDDKLHDLRKVGFTFVTTLLTAEGILIPRATDGDIPVQIKFAVFLVTLLLILALHLIDQNYRVYQRAANMRAGILERRLNLELSDTITDRYRAEDIKTRVWLLYIVFIVSVLFLGWVSLYPNWIYIVGLGAIAGIATWFTWRLNTTFKYQCYREDWTISPLECTPTDKVTITLTNMNPKMIKLKDLKDAEKRLGAKVALDNDFEKVKEDLPGSDCAEISVRQPIVFPKGQRRWEIIPEGGGEPVAVEAPKDEELHVYDSHTWILDISGGKERIGKGVYQLRPRGWPLPLHRRIIVSDNTARQTIEQGEKPATKTN